MNRTWLLGAVKHRKNEVSEVVSVLGFRVYRRIGDVERIGIKHLACYERFCNVAAFRVLVLRIWWRVGNVRAFCGFRLPCKP